ncbi:MAG TPA: hypothetical protein VFP89_08655 [Propionibacteriaceae bacterium]|nr:hypothetical protein [Propionibacteriaceae bacterium]
MSTSDGAHPDEPRSGGLNNRLNWLRAGVLGANDGIVSVAAMPWALPGRPPRWDPCSPQVWRVASAVPSRWRSVSTSR